MRIAKYIAHCGVCSRRDAEKIILAGRVKMDGVVVMDLASKVPDGAVISLDGKDLKLLEVPRLWLYHKPVGVITTHKDPQGRKTVFQSLPESLPRVMSVGRLDVNSEGLLLLTNSAELVHKFEDPKSQIERCYKVRVYGKGQKIGRVENHKIIFDAITYEPKLIEPIANPGDKHNAWYRVVLHEGKNREVRNIFEYYGYKVNRLIRTSFGPYELGDLKPGQIKEVKIL